MAPVGDAWSAPRTRVRRLDKFYQITLNLVFPSTTVPVNNWLSCCLLGVEEKWSVGVSSGMLKPLLVRITPFRMSKGVIALLSPSSFHGSSILNTAIRNSLIPKHRPRGLGCRSLRRPHIYIDSFIYPSREENTQTQLRHPFNAALLHEAQEKHFPELPLFAEDVDEFTTPFTVNQGYAATILRSGSYCSGAGPF